jgi:hypothetical protein
LLQTADRGPIFRLKLLIVFCGGFHVHTLLAFWVLHFGFEPAEFKTSGCEFYVTLGKLESRPTISRLQMQQLIKENDS